MQRRWDPVKAVRNAYAKVAAMVSVANAERTVESAIVDVVAQIAAINEFFNFEIMLLLFILLIS